ncbi:hypothetical protein H0H92_002176 [Tricholoma furcatifolium]|nr:hypothetical protein H0H92_002176 [Tricholoma furcatifolium]
MSKSSTVPRELLQGKSAPAAASIVDEPGVGSQDSHPPGSLGFLGPKDKLRQQGHALSVSSTSVMSGAGALQLELPQRKKIDKGEIIPVNPELNSLRLKHPVSLQDELCKC